MIRLQAFIAELSAILAREGDIQVRFVRDPHGLNFNDYMKMSVGTFWHDEPAAVYIESAPRPTS